jgi:hypothetical protein
MEAKMINKKIKLLSLLSIVAIAAVVGGILMTTHSANADLNSTLNTTLTTDVNSTIIQGTPSWGFGDAGFGRHRFGGFGGPDAFEVSSDFVANVSNIAKNDSDVQNLVANGYNVTTVMPIIKNVVGSQGNVTTKATSAILILENGTTGHASVLVDLEKAKVTQIIETTTTVINKS